MTPTGIKPPQNSSTNLDSSTTRGSIVGSAIWDFSGRLAIFFVLFVVGVILTRLLSPSEFGAFAIVIAIISMSGIFVDLGFRSAIIQQHETTPKQLSTVFFLNLALGAALTTFFILVSGSIERFYEIPGLANYIAAASFVFVLNAVALVPGGLLQKELRLKTLSVINTIGAAISGSVAIGLAFSGYGVWAMITQQLIAASVIAFGVFVASRWRPTFEFGLSSILALWNYGIRLFLAGLFDQVFTRLDVFIIGKLFPLQTLGFYNRAQSLDHLVKNFGSSTTTSVAFPVIARMAGDVPAVRSFYLRCLNVISCLSFLLIGVLFLTCFDIVIILFTETWTEVGYYFRIMALTAFVYPISALMVTLISARGNSSAFLKLELLKKSFLFPAYLSFLVGGVVVFLIVLGVSFLFGLGLNAYFVRREIDVSLAVQFREIYKYAIVGIFAGAIGYFGTFYIENIYIHLIITAAAFSSTYILLCYLFKLAGFMEVYSRIAHFVNAKRNPDIFPAS